MTQQPGTMSINDSHLKEVRTEPLLGSRCAVVLAGGDGLRARAFVRQILGATVPKQYARFIGHRSMLEHTLARAEKLIPSEHVFTLLNRDHLLHPEVQQQIAKRASETIIIQPQNKDTAPGIFLPLTYIAKKCPDSTVVVFPSDHFILQEDRFMAYVSLALRLVESNPSRMALLAIEPDSPEAEYGYIVPGREIRNAPVTDARTVRRFIEKPRLELARELFQSGALWNSMVMVFRAKTVLRMARDLFPEQYRAFRKVSAAIGTSDEHKVLEETYRTLEVANFSRDFLEALPSSYASSLAVIPVRGVFWSDWGSGLRIVSSLRKIGYLGRLHGISENRLLLDVRFWEETRKPAKVHAANSDRHAVTVPGIQTLRDRPEILSHRKM